MQKRKNKMKRFVSMMLTAVITIGTINIPASVAKAETTTLSYTDNQGVEYETFTEDGKG